METSCPRDGLEDLPGPQGPPHTKDAEQKYSQPNARDFHVELTVATRPDEEGAQYDSEKAEESILDNSEKAACSADYFAGGFVRSVDAERDVPYQFVSREPGAAFKVFRASALLNEACDFIVACLRVLIVSHDRSENKMWGSP
jgi:hypothetical protein